MVSGVQASSQVLARSEPVLATKLEGCNNTCASRTSHYDTCHAHTSCHADTYREEKGSSSVSRQPTSVMPPDCGPNLGDGSTPHFSSDLTVPCALENRATCGRDKAPQQTSRMNLHTVTEHVSRLSQENLEGLRFPLRASKFSKHHTCNICLGGPWYVLPGFLKHF